jgi:uncharacterized XkdX family phage protein
MSETTHSTRFKTLRDRYRRNGCTKDQLRRFVELGALRTDEYEEITGEPYEE